MLILLGDWLSFLILIPRNLCGSILNYRMKTFAGLAGIGLAVLMAAAGWVGYTAPNFKDAEAKFIELSRQKQASAVNKVNAALKSIYEGTRTLAALPSVRSVSRHAENFTEEARVTFQQVYNNLASNIRVSEVYILPADFDPERFDPVTRKNEEPILMFDELIVDAGANNPYLARKPATAEAPEIPEVEEFEYAQMKQMTDWFKQNHPNINEENMLDVPMISGPSVITCDNTDYVNTKDDADRMGVVFAVPFYGMDGKYRGMVAAIILNNGLRDSLIDDDLAIVNTTYGYTNFARDSEVLRGSMPYIRGGKPDPSLMYSEVMNLPDKDPRSQWAVWAGHTEAQYLQSQNYLNAKRLRQFGLSVVGLLGLFAAAFWLQMRRNLKHSLKAAASAAVSEAREAGAAQHISRVTSALETATSAFMLVNPDGTIVALNSAARSMFDSAATNLRNSFPEFDAATLIGASIGMFDHDLPSQLGSAETRKLALSDRHFKITLTPVMTDLGEHAATAIEWIDMTAQIETEKQVGAIVRAASHGDFSRRIDLSHKSGFLLDLSRSVNDLTAMMDRGLNEAVRVMSGLAQGDLRQRFTGDFKGSFKQLQTDANAMAESMSQVVRGIATVSEKVDETTRKLAAGMNNLSSRSEQNASSLEETSAQMEEFSTALLQSAAHAGQANRLAATVSSSATSGTGVATSAIDAVTRIQESSRKIGEIVGLIQDIAFQTNILSLNAAVEAARAGEAGKGFAVVATEVRALAQRTAAASKDIKALVLNTEGQVRGGVELVTLAGTSLSDIVTSVKDVAGYVSEIAKTASEQSSGIKQVSSAVSDMEQLTQQNAALVAETDAALQRARGHVQELQEAIRFFKLDHATETKVQALG
jgi:methyl-accepting chemotaxis protein